MWRDDGNVVADADFAHPASDLGEFLKLCLSGSTCKMGNHSTELMRCHYPHDHWRAQFYPQGAAAPRLQLLSPSVCVCVCVLSHFSPAQLFVMLWTVVLQALLSMGFSRQEY